MGAGPDQASVAPLESVGPVERVEMGGPTPVDAGGVIAAWADHGAAENVTEIVVEEYLTEEDSFSAGVFELDDDPEEADEAEAIFHPIADSGRDEQLDEMPPPLPIISMPVEVTLFEETTVPENSEPEITEPEIAGPEIAGSEIAGSETAEPLVSFEEDLELFVSPATQVEALREIPLFLDDADDFVPRIQTLSERDADRALIALAEARAKAERGGLLRVHRTSAEEVVPEEVEASPVAAATDEGPLPLFDSGNEDDDSGRDQAENPAAPPPLSFPDRVERYVARATSELGAMAVAVSDRDGFLLFAHGDDGRDDGLQTALLLEVAGQTDRLLGLDRASATQISIDGGAWRCLIRAGEGNGGLCAGFRLEAPLEQREIEHWRNALAEILPHTLDSK